MTVQEFITNYDADHENTATNEQKLRWLKHIELTVMSDVMHQYNDNDKPGIFREKIMYPGYVPYLINGENMDISDEPVMYADGDGLVLTSYDPQHGYNEAQDMDMDYVLQIKEPYDNIYEYYLDMRIAHVTGDTTAYNNAAEMFNSAYQAFRRYFSRTNYPNHTRKHLFRHEAL